MAAPSVSVPGPDFVSADAAVSLTAPFKLTVAPAPVVKLTKTLWVVEPSGAVMTRVAGSGISHANGIANAGFMGLISLRPTDVSFYRCQFREGSADFGADVDGHGEISLLILAQNGLGAADSGLALVEEGQWKGDSWADAPLAVGFAFEFRADVDFLEVSEIGG